MLEFKRVASTAGAIATVFLVVLTLWLLASAGGISPGFALLRGDPLHVEPLVASVGEIPSGEPGIAEFRVTNPWSSRVTIVGLQSTCACVSGDTLPLAIEPGETRAFPVKIHPVVVDARREFDQSVVLVTDRSGPRPVLRIRATFVPVPGLTLPGGVSRRAATNSLSEVGS